MADVYIALNTTTRLTEEEMDTDARRLSKKSNDKIAIREKDRPLSALGALVRSPHMVLLGDPGGGKSTFVNHLAFCLASDQLDRQSNLLAKLEGWPADWSTLLPVPVTLRELAAWYLALHPLERKVGLLHAYLAYDLGNRGLGEFHQDLCNPVSNGSALLLLDGWDEVPLVDDVLKRVREMINALASELPKAKIVVTCRVLSYQDRDWQLDKQPWQAYELDKLNGEQIDHFIRVWHHKLADMKVIKNAHQSLADEVSGLWLDLTPLDPAPLLPLDNADFFLLLHFCATIERLEIKQSITERVIRE